MKTKDIITAVNSGVLNMTGHTLPEEEYYKMFRFKRAVRAKYEEFRDAESALLDELSNEGELKEQGGKKVFSPVKEDGTPDTQRLMQFRSTMDNLLKEEADVSVGRISMRYYKALYDENRKTIEGKDVDILADPIVEDFVIDNLFGEME